MTTKETTNPVSKTLKTRYQNTKNINHKPSQRTQRHEPSGEPTNQQT